MSNIKAIVILILLSSSAMAMAKPKPKTPEEWERCVAAVPGQMKHDEGIGGTQVRINALCGQTKPVGAKGMPAQDCDSLVRILAECKSDRAEDIWSLSDASSRNTESLLAGNKLKQYDAECARVGRQGGALLTRDEVKAKYCGAK